MDRLRVERVNKEIMRGISEFLLNNTKDPALKKVVITEVRCTNDLSLAKVYFTSIDKSELEEISKSLDNLSGALSGIICRQMRLRFAPKLLFVFDDSEERAQRIEALLNKIAQGNVGNKEDDK
ncbi:MAG: 30S ribosome-binding factor RbfA [Acetomicrobium sp.]|jgi:ribosome-binding factor A|uniref:30S ribosome-binding factor RbfA n=1 Tax=Acetomicrobium TaxID=49894 RepID=UPI00169583F8|nr:MULTISPECIES: 30S ribosome-binding factor RbfA [Acetomicrobium]MDI9376855.1 30S ribosome-binding factor RbfA [Synergistota bacterium]NLI42077.1 30S ribosome-binding factor RbfA [Synergistaceae bacterium]MBP8675046.1 30S ribosome-binding factor RbfA [Acetomicrobium sp.]MDR9770642.1 30S ribosome-binding factor RbfA [Acetomicrobium sp.]HOB10151.1 30S ribosome-binding factor RbfA [Acetomicrobium sp.]